MSTPAIAPLIVFVALVTAMPSMQHERVERGLSLREPAGARRILDRREAAVAAGLRDRDRVRRAHVARRERQRRGAVRAGDDRRDHTLRPPRTR